MGNDREPAATAGVFDKKPEQPNEVPERKEEFKDPFKQQSADIQDRSRRPKKNPLNEDFAEKAASAINNSTGSVRNVQSELDEMETISEEDIALAEKMIFDGYADFDASMPNLPKNKFTICSTSAEEMAIIDEIVFEMLKDAEKEDGSVDLPQNRVNGMKNALYIAMSYRGMNRQELVKDSNSHLNSIKKSIIQITELQNLGKLNGAKEVKTAAKKALLIRAAAVDRMAHPLIDFLSAEKYAFDAKMLKIMSAKNLLPKS